MLVRPFHQLSVSRHLMYKHFAALVKANGNGASCRQAVPGRREL